MKCDEVQTLQAPYLDSELDARTTVELQQHLKSCPECARLFDEQEKLDARVMLGLSQGQTTAALWEQIERAVAAAASSAARPQAAPRLAQCGACRGFLSVMVNQLQAGWRRSPGAWAGLAAAWLVVLVLNFAAREPEPRVVAGKQLPPAAEVRLAVKQKRLLLAELAFPSEPTPADKLKAARPSSPHSERRKQSLNT